MRYYSDLTKQFYESEKECVAAEEKAIQAKKEAEAAAAKKSQERKARAEEIDASFKRLREAQKEYWDLISKFTKDYGSYHKSYGSEDLVDLLSEIFDL